MSKTITKVGPADHGRRMSLGEFEHAEVEQGYHYNQKPEEYLRLGVKEYWIVDADERAMIVMRQSRGRWIEKSVRPPAGYRTRLLPGLVFSCSAVFNAAGLA
jgi:Uma2 family endonuclease